MNADTYDSMLFIIFFVSVAILSVVYGVLRISILDFFVKGVEKMLKRVDLNYIFTVLLCFGVGLYILIFHNTPQVAWVGVWLCGIGLFCLLVWDTSDKKGKRNEDRF
ncbi:MAG: hypothetical protein NT162_00265 [Candidatus Woesebacteria bacterium]|nr:hypothetical protein [Candidatus Woesebacteria bacterium]